MAVRPMEEAPPNILAATSVDLQVEQVLPAGSRAESLLVVEAEENLGQLLSTSTRRGGTTSSMDTNSRIPGGNKIGAARTAVRTVCIKGTIMPGCMAL